MSTTHPARHLGVTIERSAREVADFLAAPQNFARWASGLGTGLRRDGERWRCDGPDGPVFVRFTAPNSWGIADHWVTLPNGSEIALPIRVVANGSGAEVVFTLFRQAAMTDEKFEADAAWVVRDLAALKKLLEGG